MERSVGRLWQQGEQQVSPPPRIAAKRVDVLFCTGVNVVVRTEGVRALPWVGRPLTQSPPRVFDVGTGVCACLCVRACLHARVQLVHGRRWLRKHREQLVSPLHRGEACRRIALRQGECRRAH
jgi:hypothetical protein